MNTGGSAAITELNQAGDVVFNSLANDDALMYSSDDSAWKNTPLSDKAALSTGGGQEKVVVESVSGTYAADLASGNVFFLTLTGNTTLSVTGAEAGKACAFTLYVKQDGTGSRTLSLPTIKWAGGTVPSISTNANAVDVFVIETLDGGSTWYGSLVGNNFS